MFHTHSSRKSKAILYSKLCGTYTARAVVSTEEGTSEKRVSTNLNAYDVLRCLMLAVVPCCIAC